VPSNLPSISQTGAPQGADALRQFQLTTQSIKDKSSKEYGLSVSKEIWGYVITGLQGYFYNRNARFVKNRNYANGRINIQTMFQDRFQFNGKQNYIALNWNALQIVNRIISGLVGRWMKRNEKIQVQAIDDLSQTQKKEQYEQIEFILENRAMLEKLEQESGVNIIPKDDSLPRDKEELNIWKANFQKIPEEVQNELGCNDVLTSNGWFDVLKEKMLHDAAETLFVGTYTYMDSEGVIHVDWLKPENCIYSYSDYPDFRDTSWRGHLPSRKISELRRMYGKEFHPENPNALTEEELWNIAQKAKDFQYWNNLQWTDVWVASYMRPYDEWNIRTIEFELKSVDSDNYTKTTTNLTGSTYLEKGMPKTRSGKPKEKADNQEIIGDTNWNIYRGVYLPDCDRVLEWGIKKNMIRPQDPKEIGNAEFSYSFYMPQNYVMRNLAIPEKIEAAVDGMILACLKIQQDVSMAIPPGWVIDETAWQGMDYGLGDEGNKAVDQAKLFFQTGKVFYKGLDAEGNRVPVPVQEIANTGFQQHIEAFARTYQFWYQSLKDELGEDPNLMSQALQPRVTAGNVEASQLQAEYATDYIYRAYTECMKITARKVSCLLKDSIQYGAAAYRNIVKEEDIGGRIFTTDIRFLPTEQDIMRFEAMMNQAMMATPELNLFINPFQLMQMAKEDVKLAWLYFNQGQKKMLLWQKQTAAENQQATIEGQIKSAQAAEEAKQATESLKGEIEIKKTTITGEAQNRTSVINMITSWLAPNADGTVGKVPPEYQALVQATVQNIMTSAILATEEQKQQIAQQMQQAQMEQQQEQMEQQQGQEPQQMQSPQQPQAA
jgi:hypothetical protein